MNSKVQIERSGLPGILILLIIISIINCSIDATETKMEKVTSVATWASPYWGYHTPKIVRNNLGELWTISMAGKYPGADMQIHKRTIAGQWVAGKIFSGYYQPGMLLLDSEGRLNIILNSQEKPEEHWRSLDSENLNQFALIAKGNGVPDGRGWYVGTAIDNDVLYQTYVTLDYTSYLSTKGLTDTVWSPAQEIHDGYAHKLGNHSLLYSGFEFSKSNVFICGSYSRDGSVHNTYEEIILKYYPIGQPDKLLSETIFKGDSGYYSFGYDMVVDSRNEEIYVAHSAGIHSYGPTIDDPVEAGLYVSVGKAGTGDWTLNKIMDGSGSLALYLDESKNALYAFITSGGWFDRNILQVKESLDKGKTWKDVSETILTPDMPTLEHPYFIQVISPKSGSVFDKPILVFSNMSDKKNADSLYVFDLYCLEL